MVVGCYSSAFLWFRFDVGSGIDYVVGVVMVVVCWWERLWRLFLGWLGKVVMVVLVLLVVVFPT